MSDINLNLDGLIAFLAAAGLGLLLLFAMLLGAIIAAVRAHQRKQRFTQQLFFPHLMGMTVSLLCCLGIELVLLFTDSTLPPRNIPIWLDRWILLWLLVIVILWPVTVWLVRKNRERAALQFG
jgi:hypothetical protein